MIDGRVRIFYWAFSATIASRELMSSDYEVLFAAGNLASTAISNFVSEHNCNKYCTILGIQVSPDSSKK